MNKLIHWFRRKIESYLVAIQFVVYSKIVDDIICHIETPTMFNESNGLWYAEVSEKNWRHNE